MMEKAGDEKVHGMMKKFVKQTETEIEIINSMLDYQRDVGTEETDG